MTDALRAHAAELGVQTAYHDVDGTLHHAVDGALEAVVAVLEADRAAARAVTRLAPPLHIAATGPLPVDARVEAATIDVGDGPIELTFRRGDVQDMVDLPDLPVGCHVLEFTTDRGPGDTTIIVAPPMMPRADEFAGRGGLFVPTYALWERDAPLPSFAHLHQLARDLKASGIDVVATLPLYAAFLDEPFDPSPYSPISRLHWNELYLDDAALPHLPVPDQHELIDWRTLAERRRRQLIEAVKRLDDAGHDELTAFTTAHPDVGAYARFLAGRDAGGGGFQVEQSHVLAQYLADQQLQAIRHDPDAAALALDLPIGSHPNGYEVWADPSMFAPGISVGAPPDSFFSEGQSWGFPPPLPSAMHASGHRMWQQLITRVGRHADILRIDHAMAFERLWWVPDGFSAQQGVYVAYPREEIMTVIAASAAAAGLTIVGEDLGTVPPEVSDAFERWGVLGMYEEQFHLDTDPLPHIPARAVAGIRTHDMTPLAELLDTTDTTGYRQRLGKAHGSEVTADWDDVVDHMLARLAASDAYLVIADLDDLAGVTHPHNLPGRVVDGLWSRRLGEPTSELLADPDIGHRLSILGRTT